MLPKLGQLGGAEIARPDNAAPD